MSEELVSFETAELAKEKGFDVPVNNFYYKSQDKLDNGDGDSEFIILNHNKYKNYFSSPSQSILQKWLREKHRIHCESRYIPHINKYDSWIFYNGIISSCGVFKNLEDALEKALEKGLGLIKNQ